MLPPQAIYHGLQTLSLMLRSELESVRERELTARVNHLHTLRAEVEKHRTSSQKEVLLAMLKLAQHVFDRKMDALQHSFDELMSFLRTHQAALIAEKETLTQESLLAADKREFLLKKQRLSEVSKTLILLDAQAASVHKDMQAVIAALSIDAPIGQTVGLIR